MQCRVADITCSIEGTTVVNLVAVMYSHSFRINLH